MPTWYWESGAPPFLENQNPNPGAVGVALNTNISFYIVDSGSGTRASTIDAYVGGADAYRAGIGFVAPYNGPGSSFTYLPGGSIDGYDAYWVILDPTSNFSAGSNITTRVVAADNYGNWMDDNWSFDTLSGLGPYLEQENPSPGSTGVSLSKIVSCFITDSDSGVKPNTIDAYVNGTPIYNGLTDTFVPPYNGPGSALTFVAGGSLDGYDGYELTIDRTDLYPQYTNYTIRVTALDVTDLSMDDSWSFRTETFAPFIENEVPSPGAMGIAVNTNILLYCADSYNLIDPSTIEVEVEGADAYKGSVGFIAPFNGPSSSFAYLPGGSVDGYDAYRVILDRTSNFGYLQTVTVGAEVTNGDGQTGSSNWSFETVPVPGSGPEVRNISPAAGSILPQGSLISFDIIDPNSDLDTSSMEIEIDGSTAYSGAAESFFTPYTGVDSYAGPTIVDGYDGYHFVFDNIGLFGAITFINVQASDSYGHSLNESWSYTSDVALNRMYYSDAYGVYKIDLADLVGESQFASQLFLSTTTSPSIPTNRVSYISGNQIDGYNLLVLSLFGGSVSFPYNWGSSFPWGVFVWGGSTSVPGGGSLPHSWNALPWGVFIWGGSTDADGYGVIVVTNETSLNTYADGYYCDQAQMNDDGTLYLLNKTLDRLEVYYGANKRSGTGRLPDFVYDGYSTPPLFNNSGNVGELLSLHIVSGESNTLDGGTRVYVGQSIGMTVIDAFDQQASPGYSAGQDSNGESTFYGISGSGATHENIGGTVPDVVDVNTDEQYQIIFVVTNDGLGEGGLTQIGMSGHRRIIFMNENSGFVPTNDIRTVTKNE